MGTTRFWIAAWVGGAAIGVANGAARELTYGRAVPEPVANRVSAASATAAFEFGLGRAQDKEWRELTAEYDIAHGRLWPLVLLTVAVGPELARVTAR